MATILESLKGVNAYPIPLRTLTGFAEVRGLTLTAEATQEVLHGAAYNLSLADLLLWLSLAPNISQGGQSYSFSDEQRADLRRRAYALFNQFEDDAPQTPKTTFGYKGSRL